MPILTISSSVHQVYNTIGQSCLLEKLNDFGHGKRHFLAGLQDHGVACSKKKKEARYDTNESKIPFIAFTTLIVTIRRHFNIPMAMAIGSVHMGTMTGKLNGTTEATTPRAKVNGTRRKNHR